MAQACMPWHHLCMPWHNFHPRHNTSHGTYCSTAQHIPRHTHPTAQACIHGTQGVRNSIPKVPQLATQFVTGAIPMLAGARPCGTVDFGASSHFLYLEGFKTYFFFSWVGVLVLVFDLQNFVIKASLRYLFLYGDFHLGGCIPKLFWLCLKTTQNPPLRHSHINKMEKQQSSPRTHHAPASETAGAGGDGSSGPCTSSPALDTPGGSSPSRSSGSSVQSCESSGSKRRHQGNMAPQPPPWPLVHNALDTLALALPGPRTLCRSQGGFARARQNRCAPDPVRCLQRARHFCCNGSVPQPQGPRPLRLLFSHAGKLQPTRREFFVFRSECRPCQAYSSRMPFRFHTAEQGHRGPDRTSHPPASRRRTRCFTCFPRHAL